MNITEKEQLEFGEVEQALLGCLLLNSDEHYETVSELVNELDFFYTAFQKIFSTIKRLVDKGEAVDPISVYTEMSQCGLLTKEEDISPSFLNDLALNTPSQSKAATYARSVREFSTKRRLVGEVARLQKYFIENRSLTSDQLIAEFESRANSFERSSNRATLKSLDELVKENLSQLEIAIDNPNGLRGVPSGFTDLDEVTTGLQPGDLIILAGRPSMGKTAMSLNIAEHVAINEAKPVLFFSMEMPGNLLSMRILASQGRIDAQNLRKGTLTDLEYSNLTHAIEGAQGAPFFVDDRGGLTTSDIRAITKRLVKALKDQPLGLIVVDYIQLMAASKSGANRAEAVSEISRELKRIAKEFNVPLIALSQLNRALEQRPNKRPIMSDLKESGGIEQDADVILFVYRDEVYNPDSMDKGTAEIIVAKQRNGPIATIRVAYLNKFSKFTDHYGGSGAYSSHE